MNPIRCLPLLLALNGSALAQMLVIDLASQPIDLLPDTAGQQVGLYIDNADASVLLADAATLKFQVDDGLNGGNAPAITAVDAITGTPWSPAGGFQNVQTGQAEYWDVRVFANFFSGQHASLPAEGLSLLATVTFDTTGLTGGSWSFRMAGLDVDPINSKFELTGGGTYFPTTTAGTVSISPVPEPETVALATGIGLVAFAAWRRREPGHRG